MSGAAALAPSAPIPNRDVLPLRAAVLAVSLAGLALSIVSMMHARGVIRPFWEPLPRVTSGGWILPVPAAPSPEFDVVGFSSIALIAVLGGAAGRRNDLGRMMALAASTSFTSASALFRWSRQHASTGETSAIYSISTALAVASLFFAAVDADAVIGRVLRRIIGGRAQRLACRRADTGRNLASGGAVLLGLWLLVVPASFACPVSALHAHAIGPSVIAVGAYTVARVARAGRWVNAALGTWLLSAPLLYDYELRGAIHSIVIGILLSMVSVTLDASERESWALDRLPDR